MGVEKSIAHSLLNYPDGTVGRASVERSSGSEALDDAALSAARIWRFSPASKDGVPTTDVFVIPFRFRLR